MNLDLNADVEATSADDHHDDLIPPDLRPRKFHVLSIQQFDPDGIFVMIDPNGAPASAAAGEPITYLTGVNDHHLGFSVIEIPLSDGSSRWGVIQHRVKLTGVIPWTTSIITTRTSKEAAEITRDAIVAALTPLWDEGPDSR